MRRKNLLNGYCWIKTPSAVLFLALLVSGCVPKGIYDRDVGALSDRLQRERADHAAAVKALEVKIADRARSLAELTNRYIVLEKEKEQAQVRINSLRSDLESLLRDMAELRMVIDANVKGSGAAEMKLKLSEMQNRVQTILGKQSEAVSPASPVTH